MVWVSIERESGEGRCILRSEEGVSGRDKDLSGIPRMSEGERGDRGKLLLPLLLPASDLLLLFRAKDSSSERDRG